MRFNAVVRWQMDKPIRFGDRRIFPPLSSFDFISRRWMKCESDAWTSSITIQYVNGGLTQILMFDGHEQMHSISCNEWWGWLCAAHTLGCLSDSLSQWLSQNLPSCPFYVRLWIRHRPILLKLFEIYSHSYATFSSSILGKKHLIQLPPTICMV